VTADVANTINDFVGKVVSKAGDFTVESFTDGMAATFTDVSLGSGRRHELNDIIPLHGSKPIEANGVQLQGGGFANILFADLSTRRVNDTGGYSALGDGWVGAYRSGGAPTGGTFVINPSANAEIRDDVHVGFVRKLGTAGGGSVE
jgi:prepilin-type processing-associated H-X9-DG protein